MISLYYFLIEHWNEIVINLTASAIVFPAEALITIFCINKLISRREYKRWRPARRNVVKVLYEAHRTLFNAAHHVVDPGFHVEKRGHMIPESVTQADANYWGKSVFIPPLDDVMDRLKKTIEYNNAALDSEFLPAISDFLISAEELHGNIKFMINAYNPKNPQGISCFHPREHLYKMELVYKKMINTFPEIKNDFGNGPVAILTAVQLEKIYDKAALSNNKIEFIENRGV
ncbi:hypothetical protein [Malikia spinosa]|uniref:hypothetical protein n=1 Tax=Malikia spinosa TaxID=86180 RepID=UPI0011B05060|nr:hypothetical protein [Malikia spinosa]